MKLKPLSILLIGDSESDTPPILRELTRGGFLPEARRLETPEAFRAALAHGRWDLVISDHALPGFGALEALDIMARLELDIPFFVVAGSISEEEAVRAMEAGAHDYLLKDQLRRLAPAVVRELREAQVRSDRRRAQARLRENLERYRLLVENSNDLVMELAPDGTLLYASPNHRTITGYRPEELLGSNILAYIHPEDLSAAREDFRTRHAHRPYRYHHKDGSWTWLESSGRPFSTSSGRERSVVVSREVTERVRAEETRRRLEAQLRQAQKMEAIGTLAGGIAHDFNNILTGVLGNIQLAELELPPASPARAHLQDVVHACKRARDLVAQILTFSRQREQPRSVQRLNPIAKEVLRLLRATLPTTVGIVTELSEDLPPIECDASQIHQILMNLCTNAAHAMRDTGGILTVSTAAVHVDEGLATAVPSLRIGPYVRLSVQDTGCGMDSATIDRIFDPFFTTKTPGEGTGLGLAVVHGIMQNHGGAITVSSEPGRGTLFHLYFPALATQQDQSLPAPVEPRAGAGQRVLFVDDESSVVAIGTRLLERLGYRPTAFTDSQQALHAFQQDPSRFDVVLSDLTMPRLPGNEFARRVLDLRPGMPVIITTGFLPPTEVAKAEAIGVRFFLEKPFTLQGLAENLHIALQASASSEPPAASPARGDSVP